MTDNADQFLGRVIDDRWRIERYIDSGAFGSVYQVRRTDLDQVSGALKLIKLEDNAAEKRTIREIATVRGLQHDHLLTYLDSGQLTEPPLAGTIYVVTELCPGGTLNQSPYWGVYEGPNLPVQEALRDVALGLAYLHDRGVVHRDVKPSNVLSSAGTWKVADFGLALGVDASATVGAGTPLYMAPETFDVGYSPHSSADVYAFGVMAHEGLTGTRPTRDGSGRFVLDPVLRSSWADAIAACLAASPDARPSADDLVATGDSAIAKTMSGEVHPIASSDSMLHTQPRRASLSQQSTIGGEATPVADADDVGARAHPGGDRGRVLVVGLALAVTALVAVLAFVLLSGPGDQVASDTSTAGEENGQRITTTTTTTELDTSAADGGSDEPGEVADAETDDSTSTTEPAAVGEATNSSADSQPAAAPVEEGADTEGSPVPPDRVGEAVSFEKPLSIDLDSSALDWGLDANTAATSDFRPRTGGSQLWRAPGIVAEVQGERALENCFVDRLAVHDRRVPLELVEGRRPFCMETTEGGWAWIEIVEQDPSNIHAVTISVHYWSPDTVATVE